jgi:hypothetical protein
VIVIFAATSADVVLTIVSVTVKLLSLAAEPPFNAAVKTTGIVLAPETRVFAVMPLAFEQPAVELTVKATPAVLVEALRITAPTGVTLTPGVGVTPTTIE